MYTVYGIKNCNTVKKSLDYLNRHQIPYTFHDYKKKGVTSKKLAGWAKQIGWEPLINKKGTTWRLLDETIKASVTSQAKALALAKEKTSVIKRPLIEKEGMIITLGFDEATYDGIHWSKSN